MALSGTQRAGGRFSPRAFISAVTPGFACRSGVAAGSEIQNQAAAAQRRAAAAARAYFGIAAMLQPLALDTTFSLPRLFGVVRDNRGFRRLYAANAVSQMGDWFN